MKNRIYIDHHSDVTVYATPKDEIVGWHFGTSPEEIREHMDQYSPDDPADPDANGGYDECLRALLKRGPVNVFCDSVQAGESGPTIFIVDVEPEDGEMGETPWPRFLFLRGASGVHPAVPPELARLLVGIENAEPLLTGAAGIG